MREEPAWVSLVEYWAMFMLTLSLTPSLTDAQTHAYHAAVKKKEEEQKESVVESDKSQSFPDCT